MGISNRELAHKWAHQTKEKGKGSNLYFEKETIYSYGSHYKAAMLHDIRGTRFALVNSYNYSNSTSRHLNYIRSALNGLMNYFACSDVTDTKLAVFEAKESVNEAFQYVFKIKKIKTKFDIDNHLNLIKGALHNANLLRSLLGNKELELDSTLFNKAKKHLEARLKRYHELNTPEAIKQREIASEKRKARAQAKLEEKIKEDKQKFLRGEIAVVNGLGHQLIRINGDTVETSGGAKVPLKDVKRLFLAIIKNESIEGLRVGDYGTARLFPTNGDTLVIIGCHKIWLSEAAQALRTA